MTASNPKLHIDLNILLDDGTDQQLEELKATLRMPKSQIVRAAIQNHHRMRFGRTPTCAHGEACRMPQAFAFPTAQPVAPQQQPSGPDPHAD